MSEQNVELLRRLYAEFERGNFWELAELYDPDLEWRWSRSGRALVGGATYRGRSEVLAAMREWLSGWESFRVSPQEFIDAGARVVVVVRAHATLKDGAGEIVDNWADVYTLREGKIVAMEAFDDRREAMRAAGLVD
jgi:ketosteroid isomerase-like protein